MSETSQIPLALTMGEPAGIGPELAIAAWQQLKGDAALAFVYVGDGDHLGDVARARGVTMQTAKIAQPADARAVFPEAIPVLDVPLVTRPTPGQPASANAKAVSGAIEEAVSLALAGKVRAVVTNPISKAVMYEGGFSHPGHTEYLAALSPGGLAANRPVMMLAAEMLRTVPVTVHMPLKDVPAALTSDLIVSTGEITAAGLRRHFGIGAPRLAIAGLNPHAGEHGALGHEDEDIVRPAVERLNKEGISATGPLPADTMFHEQARTRYDAALCMFHDQALVPVKTLAFDQAVNVTLGLPFVRTSPDHGTALDIAGQGVANPASLIAALRLAGAMATQADAFDAAQTRASAAG